MQNINVIKNIIEPLEAWFGREMPQGRADVYSEVLCSFTPNAMQRAIQSLKMEWIQQGVPQPAVVLEYCQKASMVPDDDAQMNYGQASNGDVKGEHHGVGIWSPEERYQKYKWSEDNDVNFNENKRKYLRSYEAKHINKQNAILEPYSDVNKSQVGDILKTHLGRLALSQGWANAYVVSCLANGVPKQTDDVLKGFQVSQEKMKQAYESLDDSKTSQSLKNLYHTMRDRNVRLYKKYKHLTA